MSSFADTWRILLKSTGMRAIFLMIFCTWLHLTTAAPYLEEYCWRDFEGIVPTDAFLAGVDAVGKQIYIGQVLFEDKLEPGKIYKNDKNIYFEMGNKEIVLNENVKILCTVLPHQFKWVPTDKNNVSLLVEEILIRGGFEPSYYIYIGRVKTNSFVGVGKIVCSDSCLAMYTTDNGTAKNFDSFEVLTYSRTNYVNVLVE
ncbi:hypothetical protein FQR65_LT11177 [Abscondita terminalis]|nr:hypothetical protein FQR65_LT11177 [Abscondita terminalis]